LAKPNYAFQKRQRDLAKKQRKEAKLQKKAGAAAAPDAEPDTASEAAPAEPAAPSDKTVPQ
jgi:hypothetical protein